MKMISLLVLSLSMIAMLSVSVGFTWQEPDKTARDETVKSADAEKKADESTDDQFVPIDSMHHFMEYISQPSYLALKEKLAEEPTDRRVWRTIKSHALILAETSALVAQRAPEKLDEEQTKLWKQISLDVYKSGTSLYKSNGDFAKAREGYESMIENCNRCHQEFDNGKHQLEK
jgi:hypothetical protein